MRLSTTRYWADEQGHTTWADPEGEQQPGITALQYIDLTVRTTAAADLDSFSPLARDTHHRAQPTLTPATQTPALRPWLVIADAASGDLYFSNRVTGGAEWTLPTGCDAASEVELGPGQMLMTTAAGRPYVYDETHNTTVWVHDEVGSGPDAEVTDPVSGAAAAPSAEAEAWGQLRDDQGNVYYYNSVTGVSVWDPPAEYLANPAVRYVAR